MVGSATRRTHWGVAQRRVVGEIPAAVGLPYAHSWRETSNQIGTRTGHRNPLSALELLYPKQWQV